MKVVALSVKCKAKDLLKIIEEQYINNLAFLIRKEK